MFSASQLSEEQKATIKEWVAEGDQMADVQRRLKDDFGFSVTYMDTRFLSLDLDLQFAVEEEEEEPESPLTPEAVADDSPLADMPPLEQEPVPVPPPEGFQALEVSLDQIALPGAMVSGKVTFSDGENAAWMIDEAGRPSIDPATPNYQPTQQDLVDFQTKLGKLLEGHA